METSVTVDEILDLLPIVADRGWFVYNGEIRDKDGRCPICALGHEIVGGDWFYTLSAYHAVLAIMDTSILDNNTNNAISDIVEAADSPESVKMGIRQRMLENLGL